MTRLHKDLDHPGDAQNLTLAIGNFDGVHKGHRALIEKAREISGGTHFGVMTFEPHPRSFFMPQAEPFRLTLLPAKKRLMEELRVPHLFAVNFDKNFASIDGDHFVDDILVKKMRVKHVVVGADFAFGRDRSGNVGTLLTAAREGKFEVTILPPVTTPDGSPYSSSAVRALLREGDFAGAASQLGYPWEMEDIVIHGDKRGRSLGYPTANQKMGGMVRLPYGIYAVKVKIEGELLWRSGAGNFGIRPMFEAPQPLFETHIFDFDTDIYGKNLRVRPVKRLRPEKVFSGYQALIDQMKQDCIDARAVLESLHD